MSSSSFSRPGAVDLSQLAARAKAQREAANRPAGLTGSPGGPARGAAAAGLVVEVTEATFSDAVVQQSLTVPVVLDFWADWCQPCKQLSPMLERLAVEYDGQFLLGTIDIEANQQLAAAAQVQSIPLVIGVVKGQIVPLFQGALPEAQVRQYLDELLKVAQANGVTGRLEVAVTDEAGGSEEPVEPDEPELDPKYLPAVEAFESGDVETAKAEYRKLLDAAPGDAEARAGFVLTSVMARVLSADETAVRAAAEADPADVNAAAALADIEATGGQLEQAFKRLVTAVQLTSGDEREKARTRLVELFELAGPDDPRVPAARRALASALF